MSRTMFPRDVEPPLRGKRFEQAKAQEAERKRWDPGYLTRDEATSIPQHVIEARPDLRARVELSRQNWPEHRAVATIALGDLGPGEGEAVQDRSFEASKLFQGGPLRAPEGEE